MDNGMDLTTCMYRPGVDCGVGWKCEHCGWNPRVEYERKERIRDRKPLGVIPQFAVEEPVRKETKADGRTKVSDKELFSIVRLGHKEFGVGFMNDTEIAAEYHVSRKRISAIRKVLREEIAHDMNVLGKMRKESDQDA